jgi:hypothetical protein
MVMVTPRGHAATPSARRRRPTVTAAPSEGGGPDIDEVLAQLDRAAAALWLLDQMHYGELCFVRMGEPRLPCWVSAPVAEAMRPQDVADWLQDMGLKTLVSALAEVKRLVKGGGRS